MGLMGREQGTCTGRGFSAQNAEGYLKYFYDWVTKTYGNHGPAWTILRDKSATPTNLVCTVDSTTDIWTCTGHPFVNGDKVQFSNSGGALPGGVSVGWNYFITVIDADHFYIYDYLSYIYTNSFKNVSSNGTGTQYVKFSGPYIIISDKSSPAVNEAAKIIRVGYDDTRSGLIDLQAYMSWDGTHNTVTGVWAGYFIKTLDASPFIYDFRGGPEFILFQSRISQDSRWYRSLFDEWTGLSNFVQPDDTFTASTNGDITAGAANVVVTLQSSTEANQFIKGRGYYIYDFRWVTDRNVCKVTYGIISGIGVADGLNADQVKFVQLQQVIGSSQTISSGAIVTPYRHRYYMTGDYNPGYSLDNYSNLFNYSRKLQIPYSSYNIAGVYSPYQFHPQSSYIVANCGASQDDRALLTHGPGDDGAYLIQRPLICEANKHSTNAPQTEGMNLVYGEMKNAFACSSYGTVDMEVGHTLDGINYISIGRHDYLFYEGGNNLLHLLCQHTEVSS